MKKNGLVFGLIAGLIVSVTMVASTAQCYQQNFEGNMLLGFASMILAFSLIFVGVKNYRDKYNQGIISFSKALKIGLYISLVASTFYVVVWTIDYYLFIPDFMEKYTAHVLNKAKNKGLSAAELQSKSKEMASYREMYKNPVWVVLLTYSEILPVGLLVSLLSA